MSAGLIGAASIRKDTELGPNFPVSAFCNLCYKNTQKFHNMSSFSGERTVQQPFFFAFSPLTLELSLDLHVLNKL